MVVRRGTLGARARVVSIPRERRGPVAAILGVLAVGVPLPGARLIFLRPAGLTWPLVPAAGAVPQVTR